MYCYIRIDRLNGKNDFYQLAKMMDERGYSNQVEYFQGNENILPHLRFLEESDALAYCLTYGGTICSRLPQS